MKREIIKTADGSHSLYVKDLDEHYHSTHGAIQEGKHVFINAGLSYFVSNNNKEVAILEIGLGTGLNTLLTILANEELNAKINYTALEAYPLDIELINELNYIELLKAESHKGEFNQIHTSEWNKEISLNQHFTFKKIHEMLDKIVLPINQFDIVYFDAFGPRVQPEMWTEEIFQKLFTSLKANGFLVTYCAKGEVKRTLKKVGFTVETLQGPPGKREMIRAIKQIL